MAHLSKKGLGKGLGALIPQGSVFTGGRTIVSLDISKVVPNPRQPRAHFPEESLKELAESIKSAGVAQPILVRQRKGAYELIAGERRLRASKLAGLSTVPAIIKDFSDAESLELALIENLQREDLNPMEEAEAYQKLAAEFTLNQADISKRVGKNRSTIANTLRLLELPSEVQKALRKDEITAGHGRALLAIEDKNRQLVVFREVIKNKLSVRDIEILVYGAAKTESKKKARKAQAVAPELKPIIDKLVSHLGTRVRIHGTVGRGRLEIDYYSQEDLERLLQLIVAEPKEMAPTMPEPKIEEVIAIAEQSD